MFSNYRPAKKKRKLKTAVARAENLPVPAAVEPSKNPTARGRERNPGSIGRKNFRVKGGPVYHPKFEWSEQNNAVAPDFATSTKGVFQVKFLES